MKDYNIKASEIKGLIRSWRARGIKQIDTMRVMMLYLGAERYMDKVTGMYLYPSFNKIRKDYKYRDIHTLMDIIIKSESFRVIRRKADHLIVAFYSPKVKVNFQLSVDLYESFGPPAVSGSDFTLFKRYTKDTDIYRVSLANKDTYIDNINNNWGASMKDAPEKEGYKPYEKAEKEVAKLVNRWEAKSSRRDRTHFYKRPKEIAFERLETFFDDLMTNNNLEWQELFEPLNKLLDEQSTLDFAEVIFAVELYAKMRLIPHMAYRKGIENWEDWQITAWVRSILQPRFINLRYRECIQIWNIMGIQFMDREIEDHI